MNRNDLNSLALGIALLTQNAAGPSSAAGADDPLARLRANNKPTIIFILADDLGWGDLGCYGQRRIQTPNIDRLAAEGMRFTACYAGSAVSAPSRAALMTGFHTGHLRTRGDESVPLQAEDVTVAEVLQPANYRTGIVGKWALGLEGTSGVPTRQGFGDFFGYLSGKHAQDYYPTQFWRNEVPFPVEKNMRGHKGHYSHDMFTMVASNYVRVTRFSPSFLLLAYTIPHANIELGAETGNGMQVPSDAPYSGESWPQPEKNKAAMITRLDRDVGALLETLEKYNLDENTAIFFSSDNGPHSEGGVDAGFFQSAGPWRGGKGTLSEGGIRVPMVVRWPAKVRAGTVSDQVWAFWDFLPTAAAIAEVEPPPAIDGISILPTLLGKKQTNQHDFFYWELHDDGFTQAARMKEWKGIRRGLDRPLELYNLQVDPGETQNVAEENPAIVIRIREYLSRARTESEQWPVKGGAGAGPR